MTSIYHTVFRIYHTVTVKDNFFRLVVYLGVHRGFNEVVVSGIIVVDVEGFV